MRTTAFVKSYFDAWNHSDPEAVAGHMAADGIYLDIPDNEQSSRDELIVDLKEFFDDNPHSYELIGEILEGRDTIAFQYRMYPPGLASRGDSGVCIHGAEFMTLRGDAALTITDYYDHQQGTRSQVPASRRALGPKYAKSGLSSAQLASYKERLERAMRTRQLYLRPNLTLPELARQVDCSVNHLSQAINSGFGMSFFDYLNQYRIEHAKGLLAECDGPATSVLNVAFAVGFNSNSAFYTAFRKFVGQAPAQYRTAHLLRTH